MGKIYIYFYFRKKKDVNTMTKDTKTESRSYRKKILETIDVLKKRLTAKKYKLLDSSVTV